MQFFKETMSVAKLKLKITSSEIRGTDILGFESNVFFLIVLLRKARSTNLKFLIPAFCIWSIVTTSL